jgi:type VI protein secretion system component Hcp
MELHYTLTLGDAQISNYSLSQQETPTRRNEAHEVREQIGFAYRTIQWTWSDGTQLSDVWELEP